MIEIYPHIEQEFMCPVCSQETEVIKTLWQGIHVGVECKCKNCDRRFFQDLSVGHSILYPCSVDLDDFQLFCTENSKGWYAKTLRDSLEFPNNANIYFRKDIYTIYDKVVILNCIDFLYGHSLLKLLNAERHLKSSSDVGLIVIVPTFLEWMVPKGIAEKWVFNIPLKDGREYFVHFNNTIQKEFERFSEVYVSKTFLHPGNFSISNFTGVEVHNSEIEDFRITFIWRNSRYWIRSLLLEKVVNKMDLKYLRNILLMWQKRKIIQLFSELKKTYPYANYTVVGIGKSEKLPDWIDNLIVQKLDADLEQKFCNIYSESRVVIGVHGSNMLLPSGHAGMTMDLMPISRWGNIAQDILFQEKDVRMSSYRYRYMPICQSVKSLSKIIVDMIRTRTNFYINMVDSLDKD